MNIINTKIGSGLCCLLLGFSACVFTGCAAPSAPREARSEGVANPQAKESRSLTLYSLGTDPITTTSIRQLESQPSAAPMKENMPGMQGMDHSKMGGKLQNKMDQPSMPGMDHGQMGETKMKEEATKPMPGMDHSGMKGMNKKQQSAILPKEMNPAEKQKVLEEMKKLSEEMKKTSDAFKALSDASSSNKTHSTTHPHP